MAGFRAEREAARLAVHEAFQVQAAYIVHGETPLLVNVRIHTKWNEVGGVKGTSFSYAETQETQPRAIFLVSEVPEPENRAIISIAKGEAYFIDNVLPTENVTVTCEVHRMSAEKSQDLPLPEDAIALKGTALADDLEELLTDGESVYQTDD